MESIVQHIREAYPSLSSSKKRVASYILNNFSTVHLDTVLELADKIGVSDTTIIHFCNDLGYYGYSDFKRAVRDELSAPKNFLPEQTAASEQIGNLISAVIEDDTNSIRETLSNPENMKSFSEAVDLLSETEKIYCIGFYYHAAFAKQLALQFMSNEYNAQAIIPDMGDYIDHLMFLEKGSVAVVFDFSLYTTALTEICTILRESGVKIILITDNGPCPRIHMADVVIHCRNVVLREIPVLNTNVACSAVCNLLLQLLQIKSPKEKLPYFKNLRQGVFTKFNPYGVYEATKGESII